MSVAGNPSAASVSDAVRADPTLPRFNGELVFTTPSESRAFGMVLVLHGQERYEWSAFQSRLIEAIAAAQDDPYYERWLAALEALAVERGLVRSDELDRRTEELLDGRRELVY
ncbi:MAG: nitrile hydratase accessory protein [Acidimicrobiales bacterium]